MIQPNNPEESASPEQPELVEIPFPATNGTKFKPNGNNVQLAYVPQGDRTEGGVIIPGHAVKLEFITASVIAVGPKCEVVKPGDRVVVALKGLVNGEKGVSVDGRRFFFTQEQVILAVVESSAPEKQ